LGESAECGRLCGAGALDERAPNVVACGSLFLEFRAMRNRTSPHRWIAAAIIALFGFLTSPFASAIDYVVTTTDDTVNPSARRSIPRHNLA
jgi:hypothetical protein